MITEQLATGTIAWTASPPKIAGRSAGSVFTMSAGVLAAVASSVREVLQLGARFWSSTGSTAADVVLPWQMR